MSARQYSQPISQDEAHAERSRLRWPGDGLEGSPSDPTNVFWRPHEIEPLAGRLERSSRVDQCRELSWQMICDLNDAGWPCTGRRGVWVNGVNVDCLVLTWKGAFLIWAIDYRWTYRQAAMVMPARAQIQREMEGWPGQVEAIFHSPRDNTGPPFRHVGVDEQSGEPVEIVLAGGRLDVVLRDWQPAGGVGLDPEWLRWLDAASAPRWWRSAEGSVELPAPPIHDRL